MSKGIIRMISCSNINVHSSTTFLGLQVQLQLHHQEEKHKVRLSLSLSLRSSRRNNNNNNNNNNNKKIVGKAHHIHNHIHHSNIKQDTASVTATADPDLRPLLEVATTSELFHLHNILFRPSYFSPLLKSVSVSNGGLEIDRFMIEEDLQERDNFLHLLESRFFYLAADARSTLRGWRPSYRNVLLDVRKELKVPCSTKLPAEDLEVEIFIFMVQKCSRDWDSAGAVRVGAAELCSALLKGGQLVSLMKISQLVSSKLSGDMLLEAAKHKFGSEVVKKGLTGATSRYLGLRSLASLFGPMLWGTFLADVVIQMLGTDYIRILQAIYAFAQIRILRRHGLHLDKPGGGF